MVLRKRARHLEHFSRDLSSLNVWKSRRSSFRGDFWRLLLFLYGHKCRVNDSGTVKIVDIHQVFRFKQAHVRLFSNTFNTFCPNWKSFQKCISSFIFKVFQVIWESLLCHKPALDWVIKLLLRFYVHSTDATDMTRHFFPDAIIFPISQNQKKNAGGSFQDLHHFPTSFRYRNRKWKKAPSRQHFRRARKNVQR